MTKLGPYMQACVIIKPLLLLKVNCNYFALVYFNTFGYFGDDCFDMLIARQKLI